MFYSSTLLFPQTGIEARGEQLYLSCDRDFVVGLEPKRTLALVCVVKCYGHRGFGDAGLTVLVHQILEIGRSHLGDKLRSDGNNVTAR